MVTTYPLPSSVAGVLGIAEYGLVHGPSSKGMSQCHSSPRLEYTHIFGQSFSEDPNASI